MNLDAKPKITVIIPAYNEELTIGACLESIQGQNYTKKVETIVINGPSTDRTAEIVKSFKGIRLVELSKRGIGRAWKMGVEKCSGEYIAITEADCTVPNNWLQEIERAFDNQKIVGVVGRYELNNVSKLTKKICLAIMKCSDRLYIAWRGYPAFRGTNFAVRAKILNLVGGFNENIASHGDIELSPRVAKKGVIRYMPELVVKTTSRHLNSPIKLVYFLRRLFRALYYIEIIKKPELIQTMFDIR